LVVVGGGVGDGGSVAFVFAGLDVFGDGGGVVGPHGAGGGFVGGGVAEELGADGGHGAVADDGDVLHAGVIPETDGNTKARSVRRPRRGGREVLQYYARPGIAGTSE
jgi:hypothetical protein